MNTSFFAIIITFLISTASFADKIAMRCQSINNADLGTAGCVHTIELVHQNNGKYRLQAWDYVGELPPVQQALRFSIGDLDCQFTETGWNCDRGAVKNCFATWLSDYHPTVDFVALTTKPECGELPAPDGHHFYTKNRTVHYFLKSCQGSE